MTDWYENQKSADQEVRNQAEALLGPECDAFAHAMSVVVDCLDMVIARGPVDDLATRWQLALAYYTFNLLWSDWDSALAGRYEPAWSHGRAVVDSCQLLSALAVRPTLVNEIESGKMKIEAARRAVRDDLNLSQAGKGTKWFRRTEQRRKVLHPFAHVGLHSVKAGWAFKVEDDKKIALLRPGGVLAQLTLRDTAVMLALGADELLRAVAHAFQHLPQVHAQLQASQQLSQRHRLSLGSELEKSDQTNGPLDAVQFLSGHADRHHTRRR